MADNIQLNAGTGGKLLASDDVGGVQIQRVKLIPGDDGASEGDASAANPFPVSLYGLTEGGATVVPISAEAEGHLEVSIQSPRTAFGEMMVASPHPVAQLDFVYGINTQLTTSSTTGSGTVTAANAILICNTTAAASSSAQLVSKRYLKYRPGQGGRARFTALFTTGASSSTQMAGAFTASRNNGFGFGYDGETFGIVSIRGGTPTWVPQGSWNRDTCDGGADASNPSGMNLVPTNGNVYQIVYQYLGFGNVYFQIENPENGQFTNVHTLEYANSATQTTVLQPSLSVLWYAANDGNASAISVKTASGALFIDGERHLLGPQYGVDNSKSGVTTLLNVLTLKNATTYNGVTNRALVRLRSISFATNSNSTTAISTLRVIRDATLGGTPAYTTINGTTGDNGTTITSGNSVVSYDTAGTSITGGTTIYNLNLAHGQSQAIDLTEQDMYLAPGETLTFAVVNTSSATSAIAVNWIEDL